MVELTTSPAPNLGFFPSPWLLLLAVQAELFFGMWLVAGFKPRLAWYLALACFTGLFGVSLYGSLSGADRCGCFGQASVNPWYTTLLDLVAVLALLIWRPAGRTPATRPAIQRPRRPWLLVGAYLLAGFVGLIAIATNHFGSSGPDENVVDGVEYDAVLRPVTWVGRRLPLDKYLDGAQPLYRGKWIVILFHASCGHCARVVPKYQQYARQSAGKAGATRIAFIEVPASATFNTLIKISPSRDYFYRRLDPAKTYYCKTPGIVAVENGRCQALLTEEDELPAL
jgi:hypothetical protein